VEDRHRKGHFRQDYIDQKQQLAAAHAVLFEATHRSSIRSCCMWRTAKIAGVETIVYRVPADARQKPNQLDKPLPVMNGPVPAGKRMHRAEMIRVALSYEEGLRVGSFVQANVPFAPEAYRTENGLRTAGEGCSTSKDCAIRTQKILQHPDIKPSLAVVDEQAGIVLLWMNFGDTHSYGPSNALVTFEAFKDLGRPDSRHQCILRLSAQGNRARLARGRVGKETPKTRQGRVPAQCVGHPPFCISNLSGQDFLLPRRHTCTEKRGHRKPSGARDPFHKATVDIIELPVAPEP